MAIRFSLLYICAIFIALACLATDARAAIIYSQTPSSYGTPYASDRSYATGDQYGDQYADDLTIPIAATARSVTWQGVIARGATPQFPLSFDLIFYATRASTGLPDPANILGSTTVSFASRSALVDTGVVERNGFNVYEFNANLTPVSLPGATKVWFSVLANTSDDTDDDFYWTSGVLSQATAYRNLSLPTGQFTASNTGPYYMVLRDTAVPEPSTTVAGAVVTAGLLARRRKPHAAVHT
ncbi:MAG: hypothetical protein JWO31_3207 [Phycisphaerales bacterium]|nr:hypothetical protein [Phycisphaerales bacterium]